MNPLAFIGYLVFAGAGLLIYVGLWAWDETRNAMIFLHILAGGALVFIVVWNQLTGQRGDAKTPSAKEDKRERTPRSSSVPSDLKKVDVVVEEWEPYPLSDRRGTPNFRVRVTATNTGTRPVELDIINFAIVDDEGEAHFIGFWDRLPDLLLEDDVLTLQRGDAAEGWLYFAVPDLSRSLHLEYSPYDVDADIVTFPLEDKPRKR